MFSSLKSILFSIGLGAIALMTVVIMFLRGAVRDKEEESTRLREDKKSLEKTQEVKDKATEALVRGLENESKPVKRGHFNTK